ncbi:hypothetical protein Athai_34020 [Actinocatenispora thailandica]|uniref:Uncharacterized protein n=1 Tax=Actinocatenispora thailandica TaxID=227318 RepID=A0A7R7HY66_9ACTN|nr:hypothetical protein Athai_34020 [Actinocatenispora thailandica]
MRLSYHNQTPTGTPEGRDTSIISIRKPGGPRTVPAGRRSRRSGSSAVAPARPRGAVARPDAGRARRSDRAVPPAVGRDRWTANQPSLSTVDIQDSTSAAVRGSASDSSR